MKLRDLPPQQDPKGGSPKSPAPIPISQFGEQTARETSSLWRTIALVLIAVDATGVTTFFTIGIDNVKHSEIQNIMETRAPFIAAKPEIEGRFKALEKSDTELQTSLRDLRNDFKKSEEDILRELHELQRSYYQDHPNGKK